MSHDCPIPTLDFSLYTNGTPSQRRDLCAQLLESFRRWGFVQLENYGIPEAKIQELFDLSRQFFALTHQDKMTAPHPPVPNPHRGYSYVGQEATSSLSRERELAARQGRRLKDVKETWDWGASTDQLFPSVWPDDELLPGFRVILEDHYAQSHALHLKILRAVAEALNIPLDFFEQRSPPTASEARLAHYPEVSASAFGHDKGTGRISEHTDSGSITLLWQDNVGGLEIEDPISKSFIPVQAPHPTLLVNLGDAMERWSNGVLKAAYHRVVQPQVQSSSGTMIPARYSIVHFAKPDRDASLAPLDIFITPERPAIFEATTGGELNQKTLLQTYERV